LIINQIERLTMVGLFYLQVICR